MLGQWLPHAQYQEYLESLLSNLDPKDIPRIELYKNSIAELYTLNLDNALELLKPLYATRGRPAVNQPEVLRALILIADLKLNGIPALVNRLRTDPLLAAICVFDDQNNLPGVGTFYDLINRLWGESPDRIRARKMTQSPISRIPEKKPQDGEKLPPQNQGIVKTIVDRIIEGRPFAKPPEHTSKSPCTMLCG